MPIKKADKFRVLDWTVKCPYCDGDNDIPGMNPDGIEEGQRVVCEHCKKKFISLGWEA